MLVPLEIMSGKGAYRSMHFPKATEYEIHYKVDRNTFLFTPECSFGISVRKGKRFLCFHLKHFKTILIPSKSVLLPSVLRYRFTLHFGFKS
jgi:hypothetical protein